MNVIHWNYKASQTTVGLFTNPEVILHWVCKNTTKRGDRMGYKVVPQMIKLVKGAGDEKHRANGGKILRELYQERYGKTVTIDREYSYLNEYVGADSGDEMWDKLIDEADNYKIVTVRKGKEYKRALPEKSTIGMSVIFKLPYEYSAQLSVAENAKFYTDTEDVLADLYPDVFAKKNIRGYAIHYDEGIPNNDKEKSSEHKHQVYVPRDENERYCGNLVDVKMLANICKQYPAKMREKGWDFEDLDTTDWDKYKSDSEYKAERDLKRKENGLGVNAYAKKQTAKEVKKQALERVKFVESVEALKQKIECANSRMELANVIADGIDAERKELDEEKQKFAEEKALQDEIVQEKVEQEVALERAKMQSEMQQELNEQKEALKQQQETLEHEREALKQERIQTQQLFAKRIREVNAYKSKLKSTMDAVNAFSEQDKADPASYDLETWCKHLRYSDNISVYDKYLADKESRQQRAKDTSDLVNEILSNGNYDTDYQK